MRVSDAILQETYLRGIRNQRRTLDRALAQLGDGKRVRHASDDPVAAAASLELRARLVRTEGLRRSAQSAAFELNTIDVTLGEVFNLISEARTIALGAGAASDQQREIQAGQIDQLRERLLFLSNTEQDGRYLFGGTETLAPPFDASGAYAGNDGEAQAAIDESQTVGTTLSGERIFVTDGDLFALMGNLAQALRDNDTAAIEARLPELKNALDRLGVNRAEVGDRLVRIEQALDRGADSALRLKLRIGELEDADIEQTAFELTSASTTLDALSAGAAKVFQRSLFDYLG